MNDKGNILDDYENHFSRINEAAYLKYYKYFDEAEKLIISLHPEKINPYWFRGKLEKLRGIVDRYLVGTHKQKWEFVSRKLRIEDRFFVMPRKTRALEDALQELFEVFEKYQPTVINVRWIQKHVPYLLSYFANNHRNDNGSLDWAKIVSLGREKWQDCWILKEKYIDKNLPQILTIIEERIKEYRVTSSEKINEEWLKVKCRREYGFLKKKVDQIGRFLDWPSFWREHSSYIFSEWTGFDGIQFSDMIAQLDKKLDSVHPEFFDEEWIKKHCPGVWIYFKNNVLDKRGVINWREIINSLPSKRRKKWQDYLIVEKIVKQYNDNYYQVFDNSFTLFNVKINGIFEVLVPLAQQGNYCAFDKVMSLLGMWIVFLLYNDSRFIGFINEHELVKEAVTNYIYSYRQHPDGGLDFLPGLRMALLKRESEVKI